MNVGVSVDICVCGGECVCLCLCVCGGECVCICLGVCMWG